MELYYWRKNIEQGKNLLPAKIYLIIIDAKGNDLHGGISQMLDPLSMGTRHNAQHNEITIETLESYFKPYKKSN